jgi:hypothetical protein
MTQTLPLAHVPSVVLLKFIHSSNQLTVSCLLQRIPTGPHNLTAETFELIQREHNYVVGHIGVRTLDKLRQQGVRFESMRALVKQFIEFCPYYQKMNSSDTFHNGDLLVLRTIRYRYYRTVAKGRL